MKKLVVLLVALFALAATMPAVADSMSFSMSGTTATTWNASGTLYGSPTGPGTWQVTGATGVFDGSAITGIWSVSNNGNIFYFNNIYRSPAPVVDLYGIVLTVANGDLVNLCYDSGCYGAARDYTAIVWNPNTGYTGLNADASATFGQPVPEPGTLVLLGGSAIALAGALRRKLMQ